MARPQKLTIPHRGSRQFSPEARLTHPRLFAAAAPQLKNEHAAAEELLWSGIFLMPNTFAFGIVFSEAGIIDSYLMKLS